MEHGLYAKAIKKTTVTEVVSTTNSEADNTKSYDQDDEIISEDSSTRKQKSHSLV